VTKRLVRLLALLLVLILPPSAVGKAGPPPGPGEYLILLPSTDATAYETGARVDQTETSHALSHAAGLAQRLKDQGAVTRFFVLEEAWALHVTAREDIVRDLAQAVRAREIIPATLEAASRARQRGLLTGNGSALTPTGDGWHLRDTFDDTYGLSDASDITSIGGDLLLGQFVPRANMSGQVLASALGANGKLYLGTAGARLLCYDPATGTMEDKGTPVPDECFT